VVIENIKNLGDVVDRVDFLFGNFLPPLTPSRSNRWSSVFRRLSWLNQMGLI